MCALHGIRHAYAQAYHHPANGRAEVAGAVLQRRLRAYKAECGATWVDALPWAVRRYHDEVGQCGLSPYEILYGRERPYASIPYTPPKIAEDAVAFFERMKSVDEDIADMLKAVHAKRAEQVNRHRRELPELAVGSKVWYLRDRSLTGSKLDTYWAGPYPICARRGEHSYSLLMENGNEKDVQRSLLKEYKYDEDAMGPPRKMWHFKPARQEGERWGGGASRQTDERRAL